MRIASYASDSKFQESPSYTWKNPSVRIGKVSSDASLVHTQLRDLRTCDVLCEVSLLFVLNLSPARSI